jgi:hypothetical protein
MKLNKSLLGMFVPLVFIFVVLMLYMPVGKWPVWAVLLGIGYALAFTCFNCMLSMNISSDTRLVWNWRSRILTISWLVLFLLGIVPVSSVWLLVALMAVSVLVICLTKVTLVSKLWTVVDWGSQQIELVVPETEVSLVWWGSARLQEIQKQEDLVVRFAIPSHTKAGLCINFFSVSCILGFEGAGSGPLRPYKGVIADLKTALGLEMQDGVVPQPNKPGVYMVNLPVDLLTNGGRLVDMGGYLIRISLIRPVV